MHHLVKNIGMEKIDVDKGKKCHCPKNIDEKLERHK